MRNLQKITEDYLSKSTDFAIQIVGKWGYGKTYFYRDKLEDLIFKKHTHNDESKTYKPIYISLFGLKSIEDIATKIVMDFYQAKIFKTYIKKTSVKKSLKITQSIFKIGLRGFLNFNKLGNVNDYLTDIKAIGENVLDTSELVICFDDLERKDSALKIEDLTGYINSLVDEGTKVLIISNEDLLLKDGEVYKNLKEKIIGITVEFIPNTAETLRNIIHLRYSSYPVYADFLTENIAGLIKLSQAIDNNFRHIIYALDSLHHCYSIIKKDIIDIDHEIAPKVLEELKNIFVLTLALAVEYKSSMLKFSNLSDYKHDYAFLDHLLNNNGTGADTEKRKSRLELFQNKYDISRNEYHLYETIFNYVTGYDEFSIEDFIAEFKRKFNLEKGEVLPQYEIFNSLSYQQCFDLSDEDYKAKTIKAIEFAKAGLYLPSEYLTIMHFAERMDNILDLDLADVKDKLIAGLRKAIETMPPNQLDQSRFEMTGRHSQLSNLSRQLHKEGMTAFRQREEKETKEAIETIANLLTTDVDQFQRQYRSNAQFSYNLSVHPLLNYAEPEALLANIRMADSSALSFLQYFFKERYENPQKLLPELEKFKHFIALLMEYEVELTSAGNQKIRTWLIRDFIQSLITLKDKAEAASTV